MVDAITFLQGLGLPQILLWLLTFAVVNGVLSQAGTPKSRFARGIISIVLAFLVILSTPAGFISTLAQLSSSIVLVLIGILLLVVFLEVGGIKAHVEVQEVDEEGKPTGRKTTQPVSIFEKYGKVFGLAILIIALLIFVNAGGLGLLGLQGIAMSEQATLTIAFFILILIAVVWMVANPE